MGRVYPYPLLLGGFSSSRGVVLPMKKAQVTITNRLGIHARPASKLVKEASQGNSQVWLVKDGHRVNARSILGLMLMQIEHGAIVTVEVEGPDEEEVLERIVNLIVSKFEEE